MTEVDPVGAGEILAAVFLSCGCGGWTGRPLWNVRSG